LASTIKVDTIQSTTSNVFFQNSVGTEYARFNSSGNLGIGISSPSFPLTVLSPSITSIAIAVNGRSSDNSGVLAFYANDGSTQYATITATAAEFRLSSVPAAAVQTFFTNSSERMRIDASGNVGIGTSSINGRLNLAVGASTACTLRFTSNGTGAGSGDRGRLDFYSADNSGTAYQLGYMDYDRADGTGTASYIAFANRVSGTVAERMRINAGAPILCLSGGSTTATGTGIAFPATQSASTDANTLDDYEEGTWTPTFAASGSNPTVSYTRQNGKYVKIGQLVYVTGNVLTSSITGGSGNTQIGGLPFAASNTNEGDRATLSVGYVTGFSSTTTPQGGIVQGGSSLCDLTVFNSSDAREGKSTYVACPPASNPNFYFTIVYRASA
jgi:hypothetical protein